jgi:DNA topoisomerase-1
VGDNGAAFAIRSDHINTVLHDVCRPELTAKTLRTWNCTHAAFVAAQKQGPMNIKPLSEAPAERLHNTPTVARNSYIHPAVIDLAEVDQIARQDMLARLEHAASPQGLRQAEAALAASCAGIDPQQERLHHRT